MKPAAARSLGLTPGEITLVITDLQGSTELWEWNPQVMDVANALHAQLARRLLKKYCGYEVMQADAPAKAADDRVLWRQHHAMQ